MFPASRNSLTKANILHGTDKCIFHWRTNPEGIWLYGLGEEDYTSAAAVLLRQLHLSGVYRLTGGGTRQWISNRFCLEKINLFLYR